MATEESAESEKASPWYVQSVHFGNYKQQQPIVTREVALMIQLEQQQHGEFWVGR